MTSKELDLAYDTQMHWEDVSFLGRHGYGVKGGHDRGHIKEHLKSS